MNNRGAVTYYKFLGRDGEAINGGMGWWPLPVEDKPGDWYSVHGKLLACRNGLHLSLPKHLPRWIGQTLYRAEIWPTCKAQSLETKICVRRARLVQKVEAWNDGVFHGFLMDCVDIITGYREYNDDERRIVDSVAAAIRAGQGAIDEGLLYGSRTGIQLLCFSLHSVRTNEDRGFFYARQAMSALYEYRRPLFHKCSRRFLDITGIEEGE